jgi:hypothetical protein
MSTVDFGTLEPGDHASETITITLAGGAAPVPLALSGDPEFSLPAGVSSVSPGTTDVAVTFTTPIAEPAGVKEATLTAGDQSWSLTATVAHELIVSGSGAFGDVELGKSGTKILQVTNRTDHDAVISVGASEFTASPATVPPGTGAMNVTVTFAPTATGSYAADLTAAAGSFTSSAALSGLCVLAVDEGGTVMVDTDYDGELDTALTKTTFKVQVPFLDTKLHLGAAATPFTLHGFGLRTDGKGLIDAKGTISVNSRLGDVRLQSESASVVTLSKQNTLVAASGSVYVMGDGGVLISSAVDEVVDTQKDADGQPSPGAITSASNAAAGCFAALDAFIAGASVVRTIKKKVWKGFSDAEILGKVAAGAGVVAGAAAATGTVLSTLSVGSAAGASLSVPGVTLYGHAGILMGTPGFGGFYSASGMVLASLFPIMIGAEAEILGFRGATITGAETKLMGWKKVGIKGLKSVGLKSKKRITSTVSGDGVRTDSKLELTNEQITMETKKRARVNVGRFVIIVDEDAGEVTIGQSSPADPSTMQTTRPFVRVAEDKIVIASKEDGPTVGVCSDFVGLFEKGWDTSTGGAVTLSNGGVQLFAKDAKASLKVMPDGIYLTQNENFLEVKAAGVNAKGKQLKWG